MSEILFYIIVCAVSYTGVELFRRWSLRRELFDIPNERSSHTTPTPRGGGAVIVAVCIVCYTLYSIFVAGAFNWAYFSGALLIAAVSWFDDLYSISFYWRFLAHLIAAGLVVGTTGFFGEISTPFIGNIEMGTIGAVLTLLWIVWLTNAYNFMDGIDGIAGMQAVIAGIGWLIVGKFFGLSVTGFYGGVIAFASLSFLIQNWQPAKIFMGDVGSAFLGYSFAVLPLLSEHETARNNVEDSYLLICVIALVWLFVFDTILTFIRRVLNGEKVWQAHRSHIYQKLVQAGHTHRAVTSLYGSISALNLAALIGWLFQRETSEKSEKYFVLFLLLLIIQSFGLLIYLFYKQKKSRQIAA